MKLNKTLLIGIIILVVFNLLSCEKSTKNQPFEPIQQPVATIIAHPVEGYAPLTVQFDASNSSTTNGMITEYIWHIGNGGEVKYDSRFKYSFIDPGTYTIRLAVCDCQQQMDEAQIMITVKESTQDDPSPNRDKLP